MINLPNVLTISRIALIPVLMALFYTPEEWAAWTALVLYSIGAFTDYLDGLLARSMSVESALGKFLDPISDKIYVGSLLIMLAGFDRLDGPWLIPAVIILIREFLVAGLREYLGPYNIQIPVSKLAKWKTTVQMVAMGFLVIGNYGNDTLPHTLLYGQVGLSFAAILTVYTGWAYLKAGLLHIYDQQKP